MAFADDQEVALGELKRCFPNAQYCQMVDLLQQNALFIFTQDWTKLNEIQTPLKRNPFSIEGLGDFIEDPLRQTGNLWQHC